MKQSVLLIAHGSPERVDDIPEFLQNISRGRPMPEAVVREVQHRYSLIGSSPLTRITQAQAAGVERELGIPVYVGMRNWHPFITDTLQRMVSDGVGHTVAICLAPHNSQTSVGLYKQALLGQNVPFSVDFVEEWHDNPSLIVAFAEKLRESWNKACTEQGQKVPVLFTAHSVPTRTVAEGDPYETQTRETAALVAAQVPEIGNWSFAFQSQGMSGGEWLGPTVEDTLLSLRQQGHTAVFVQPIGFVCDHVEILFDVDILFRDFAAQHGMKLYRAESLNDSPAFVRAVAELARTRLKAAVSTTNSQNLAANVNGSYMKRIAIIGAGISGLSAAYQLEKARTSGAAIEYTVFESGGRVGGSISSERVEGCLVEAGPDSFLTEKPWAAMLCKELGLGDQIIGSNDAQRKTYIVVHGKLVVMPDGLMFMVPTKLVPTALSPLFSWSTKVRMARELMHPPRPMHGDETVGELVERHFGAEVVDRLADPLLSGVYGGDANKLSARAVLPRFVEMEEKYGSLSRAMLAAHKKMAATAKSQPARPLFSSLQDGMQQMVDAVVARLMPEAIRLRTRVRGVYPHNGGWRVATELAGDSHYDAVIVATPANVAGALLEAVDAELANDLLGVTYSSSVTVALGYYTDQLRHLPPGFGFLVPRSEGTRMLACTFVHNKFPHRTPPDKGLLRCFLGGARDEAVLALSDDELLGAVRDELKKIIKLSANPIFARVYRWRGAMAQYESGHLARVARIEKRVVGITRLAIAGNAFHGIGVPDCVRSGQQAADKILGALVDATAANS